MFELKYEKDEALLRKISFTTKPLISFPDKDFLVFEEDFVPKSVNETR
jgi:hypothetical protein